MSLRNNKRFLFELSYKRRGEGVTARLPFDRLTREDSPPGYMDGRLPPAHLPDVLIRAPMAGYLVAWVVDKMKHNF